MKFLESTTIAGKESKFKKDACFHTDQRMECFGYKKKFIHWVKTLLDNFSSQVLINGYLSLCILLKRV